MNKKRKKEHQIIVADVIEYKGYHMLLQCIGEVFQCVFYKDGEFRQVHDVYKLPKRRKKFTDDELMNGFKMIVAQTQATIELMESDDPEELTKGKEDILKAIESSDDRKVNTDLV